MTKNEKNEKTDFFPPIKKLILYSKPYIVPIIIVVLAAIAGSIITIIGPDIIRDIVDEITKGLHTSIDMSKIHVIAARLMMLYLASIIFSFMRGFIMAGVTKKITQSLRRDISMKINRLRLKYFDTSTIGDILSRITNDVDALSQALNDILANFVASLVLIVGAIIMMFKINYILALVAISSSLLGFALIALVGAKSQKYFKAQQKLLGSINGHIEEVYSGHNIVKVYNAEKNMLDKFNTINDELYTSAWKSQFLSGLMMPIMMFIGNFGYVAVSIAGSALAIHGKIGFGVIVAFMLYVRMFTRPLSQIAQTAPEIQLTSAASKRVFDFLEEEELSDESHKTAVFENLEGAVEFENVHFSYTDDKEIIKNFSATIKSGSKVAIVGPTGAGKTTIVNLLMRFYDVNSGDIKIDGTSIYDVKREVIHNTFCMVLQDTWLFKGTIRENIVYAKEGVTETELETVCKSVGLHHYINTLPDGYDTVLTESVNISEGQKQLMTIARAMIENAPLLILDEATSSVDTRTEQLIQKSMDELTKGRTSFVIAHRLSTIKNADLILVMKDGNIVEQGTHNNLLNRKAFYHELYMSQFAG